ncbi:associated with tfs and helicases family protein [Chrysochromulina tobinii]|uniref:Associated with tfs and helicases family protein n=1 Tax=Chrysochromulina tobinii TaxID=1460289 RepID=A0A0M0JD40_9EUKA|nr:associated with tfs and helicases family protein [Chrysochromulina tobinii]|eukprot:KOO24287.1 associated with tfs and helicases family protein [Chrysochromulina sp. CCMP291]
MADGMPIEPRKASDPFADVEEDDEEEEAKLAAATAAEKAAAEKAAAGKAAADKAAADKAAAKKRRAEDGEEYVRALNKLLRPHLLRREKEDVETLQPMQEVLLHVEITNLQKVCYRAVLEHNRQLLVRGAGGTAGLAAAAGGAWANVSMMLRHCCNHPWLIKEVEAGALQALEAHSLERAPKTARERNDPLYWHAQLTAMRKEQQARYVERLVNSSGKMLLLDKLLPKLKADGHRVLIFSQFTKVLDLLEVLIEARGYGYERLDGNDRGVSRQQAIDRFSTPQSESFLFLLSTRAGGVGINLTAADTVIIYDPDWNPQNDIQAMARCHRIGQTRAVNVYKLITRDTYEMHMLAAANHKLGLEHAVSFVSEESGAAVDLDDPNFWSKILPEVGALADMDPEQAAAMDAAAEMSGASKLRATRPDHLTALDHLMSSKKGAGGGGERKRPRDEGGAEEEVAAELSKKEKEDGRWAEAEVLALCTVILAVGHELAPEIVLSGVVQLTPEEEGGTGAATSSASRAASHGGAHPRPPGRAPAGKQWDAKLGQWVGERGVKGEPPAVLNAAAASSGEKLPRLPSGFSLAQRKSAKGADAPEYSVECIAAERMFRNKLQYSVKWLGYEEWTWEPAALLKDTAALAAWEEQKRTRATQKGNAKRAANAAVKSDAVLGTALVALQPRAEDDRALKKACDCMLIDWMRYAAASAASPETAPEERPVTRSTEYVTALGYHPRPKGFPPRNDSDESLKWSYKRGVWVNVEVGS